MLKGLVSEMNYAKINKTDVANGPGIRVSIFVSGCTHYCKGCFNSEAWDFSYGELFTKERITEILEAMEADYITGLSILGGEPFEPENQKGILPLVQAVKDAFPQKTIWVYSGYDFEMDIMKKMLPELETTKQLLQRIDVIVDGKFIEEKKNLNLRFRGSENQKIILVQESMQVGKVVEAGY